MRKNNAFPGERGSLVPSVAVDAGLGQLRFPFQEFGLRGNPLNTVVPAPPVASSIADAPTATDLDICARSLR